jgi:hypothetical protein
MREEPMATFSPPGKSERQLEDALNAATPGQHDIVVDVKGNKIDSNYLRWFILDAIPNAKLTITRFVLCDATIDNQFDLKGSTVDILLRFVTCVFLRPVLLTDAKIIGIDFVSGEIESIEGDRLTAQGAVRFLAPKFAGAKAPDGEDQTAVENAAIGTRVKRVRLCGANIRGNLDMRGSKLGGMIENKEVSPTLFADGITVSGNVLLSEDFTSVGEICLNGAKINRNLDCSSATLVNYNGFSLSAEGAQINGSVLLCRPFWRDKDKENKNPGGIFRSVGVVRLQGAKITGDLNCTNSRFTATAFLNNGGERKDTKDNNTSKLYVIEADSLEVGADLTFGCDDAARDDILDGKNINSGATMPVIECKTKGFSSAITIAESSLLPADGVCYDVLGTISLINAKIGGDFQLCNTRYHFPGEETVCADGITVTGTTFLDNLYSNGILRFVQATLKQGLSICDAKFDVALPSRHWLTVDNISETELEGPSCGIYASYAQIGGAFTWQGIDKANRKKGKILFWLNVFGASAATIEDDERSWKALDRFEVTGATYGSISHLKTADCEWRLRELDRQYALLNEMSSPDLRIAWKNTVKSLKSITATVFCCKDSKKLNPTLVLNSQKPSREDKFDEHWIEEVAAKEKTIEAAIDRFKPQPYLHLAKSFRNAGYVKAARRVLIQLECNQTRYSDYGLWRVVWRWSLYFLVRYGHALFRPIGILAIWALISATCFEFAYHNNQIVPMKEAATSQHQVASNNQVGQPSKQNTTGTDKTRPAFNALIFAVDTLLPIVDLNQKKNWTVDPLSKASVRDNRNEDIYWFEAVIWVWRAVPDFVAPALLIFNTFFGWLMTTLFVAGVTGLMRSGNES